MRQIPQIAAILVLMIFSPAATVIASPLNLEWKDLIPKLKPLNDPLGHLSPEHAIAVDTIGWARTLTGEDRKLDFNQDAIEDAKKYERELKQKGHDIDKLIADYADWKLESDKRDKAVRNDLNGKTARISGYLLPLEFNEAGEVEFLLVPYVGACIHAPAPPANQVVFVSLKKSFKVDDLFTPVWVTGTINTKTSSKTLTLVDGTADVTIGYHISDATAQLYTKE